MPSTWHSAMAVDHGILDDDHKHLIVLINQFEAAVRAGSGPRRLVATLNELRMAAADHFALEEARQKDAKFAFARTHANEHAVMLTRLDGWIHTLREDPLRGERRLQEAIAADLSHLFQNHHAKSDLMMRAMFRNRGRRLAGASDEAASQLRQTA